MTGVAPQRKNLQFNLAAQGRRQAGSAFKTFVLTKAIEEGINPYTTVYLSAPFRWQPDPSCSAAIDPNCVWDVATYSNSYSGRIPIASATLASDNTVYARLTLDLGPENVAEIAQAHGDPDEARARRFDRARVELGLGARDGLGVRHPRRRRRVLAADGDPQGHPRERRRGRRGRLGQAEAQARLLGRGRLRGDEDPRARTCSRGTGTRAYFGRPAAGKTGTTENFGDAWFVGYTPNLSTAVWVGYPDARSR